MLNISILLIKEVHTKHKYICYCSLSVLTQKLGKMENIGI